MHYKHLILLALAIFSTKNYAQNIPLYVGTYTNEDAKGVYQLQFNTETGTLSKQQLAIEIDNPSFLQYSPDRKYLYSTNATNDGFVSSYTVNEDGTLTLLTRMRSHGVLPCHISLNEAGDKAAVSNYRGGTVAIFPINKDGSLNDASQVFDHNSEGTKSHAHSAHFFNDDLFVADLGTNSVFQYELKKGEYKLDTDAIVKTKDNPGPRHFTMTKDGEFMYVINEIGSSITSIKRNGNKFKEIDFDSTLAEDYKGENASADIHLSNDEKFLYATNRGENAIAVFERNTKKGTIEKVQNVSVHGDWPRNFAMDPTGNFLIVANRRSNNLVVFKIDQASGKLTYLQEHKTPTPVCLLF
ncbi:lactonase family protein [Tamlana sp. 2_MG-2023]|uniref:lactonase family protein n=1 Tax=unclassified Tamlana TaxID=2614803 RepID=UPI0026E1612E|nr:MULTISPECIES: lactonase family protein [unclassified Tamlana]MDO6761459.1 lactonase family protein [Tamlana sp. 2_MG-2023]MDO6792097.1 lactonase family protein [Tamlana sp. 1_MG-2023]